MSTSWWMYRENESDKLNLHREGLLYFWRDLCLRVFPLIKEKTTQHWGIIHADLGWNAEGKSCKKLWVLTPKLKWAAYNAPPAGPRLVVSHQDSKNSLIELHLLHFPLGSVISGASSATVANVSLFLDAYSCVRVQSELNHLQKSAPHQNKQSLSLKVVKRQNKAVSC